MSKDTSKFTIREQDLAAALEITPDRLDEIIDFFNSDPNDEWELVEGDHFIFINKQWKERIFSQHGAFAIAKYMDSIESKSLWDRLVEFITRHKEKLRNAFIQQKIHENCSSLTVRNGRSFLSKKDTVSILCTSYARVNQAFRDIQKSELPMIIYEDFEDLEGKRYYSLAGFNRLSRELSISLKSRDRQEWCKAVGVISTKTFNQILDEQTARVNRIKNAKDKAKKRDKKCQITGESPKKHARIKLAAHHIYSEREYPQLATCMDNLITLKEEVHQEFHNWNGGTQKACTANDLIRFVTERYPENADVLHRLYQVKQMFSHAQPVSEQIKRIEGHKIA